jgi:hypothetical protein
MTVSVLVPTAEPGRPITPYNCRLDDEHFRGSIGFLANSQPGSIDFLAALADELMPRFPDATAYFEDKGDTPQRSSMVMDEEELERVLSRCDAVVLAYGHCGGCTSATVRDAVLLGRRGIPVVAVVVPRFREQATQVARAVGMPNVPICVLPGPMTQLPRTERARVAANAVPGITALLQGDWVPDLESAPAAIGQA